MNMGLLYSSHDYGIVVFFTWLWDCCILHMIMGWLYSSHDYGMVVFFTWLWDGCILHMKMSWCNDGKITGLFCRIQSLLQGSFAKETYNFIDVMATYWGQVCCILHLITTIKRARSSFPRIQGSFVCVFVYVCVCVCVFVSVSVGVKGRSIN